MMSNHSRQEQLYDFKSRNQHFARHKVHVLLQVIYKGVYIVKPMASVRKIGDQVYHYLLEDMA